MYLVFNFNEEKAGVEFHTTNSLRNVEKSSITKYFDENDFNSILTVYLFYKKISHFCIRDFGEIIKNNKEIQENIKNKVLLYINT
jgi:hypothetical protein